MTLLLALNKKTLLMTALASTLLLGACDDKKSTQTEASAQSTETIEAVDHDAMDHDQQPELEKEDNSEMLQAENEAAAKDAEFAQAEEIPTDNELDTDDAKVVETN